MAKNKVYDEDFINDLGDQNFMTIMYRLVKNDLINIEKNRIYINNLNELTK